jgi:type III pantothenate kinase
MVHFHKLFLVTCEIYSYDGQYSPTNMNHTLFVDAGNTRVKCAIKSDDGWEMVAVGDYSNPKVWNNVLLDHLHSGCVVATSVSDVFDTWIEQTGLNSNPNYSALQTSSIPASRMDYETPFTLGADRWLACAGAWQLSRQAVVVCTAGTALTIDLMDQHGVFRGGVIMPGIDAIEAAAHNTANRLPIGDVLNPVTIPARSTDDSVDAGARYMLHSALHAIIAQYENTFGMLRIWVGGGRAPALAELIGRDVRTDSYLVFRGMSELVDLNVTDVP